MPLSCFWKKQCLPRPCGQRIRVIGRRRAVDHHQRFDLRHNNRRAPLGQAVLGVDHPLGIGDRDAEALDRRALALVSDLASFCGVSRTTSARRLVFAQRDEARVAQDAVGGEFGVGDLGDQLGLDPVRALRSRARHFERRLVDLERLHRLHQIVDHLGVEAGADLAAHI